MELRLQMYLKVLIKQEALTTYPERHSWYANDTEDVMKKVATRQSPHKVEGIVVLQICQVVASNDTTCFVRP
jgi:hypothetical protein